MGHPYSMVFQPPSTARRTRNAKAALGLSPHPTHHSSTGLQVAVAMSKSGGVAIAVVCREAYIQRRVNAGFHLQ